uniref:Merozoite surface antigen 2c2 n=1 Tax=Babesia orientalis TaxID=273649 RepID=A0A7S8BTE3_9APIC|nr:Merozoite surface antigen 2c2 [Babesia orientalis]
MMGAKLAIAALCCLTSYSVATQEVEKKEYMLYDDMKLFYDVMRDINDDLMLKILKANFINGLSKDDTPSQAQKAFKDLKEMIKKYAPFTTTNFDNLDLTYLSHETNETKFNYLIETVIAMYPKIEAFQKHLDDYADHTGTGIEEVKKYFKENIYDDVKDMKEEKELRKFCQEFLPNESSFMNAYMYCNNYKHMRDQRRDFKFTDPESVQTPPSTCTHSGPEHVGCNHPIEPTPEPESSVPGSSSASSTSPAAPQPVDTTSGPQGQAGSPHAPSEDVSGNLKGQQDTQQNNTASSATFTGLSVATVCYIVLSAF